MDNCGIVSARDFELCLLHLHQVNGILLSEYGRSRLDSKREDDGHSVCDPAVDSCVSVCFRFNFIAFDYKGVIVFAAFEIDISECVPELDSFDSRD